MNDNLTTAGPKDRSRLIAPIRAASLLLLLLIFLSWAAAPLMSYQTGYSAYIGFETRGMMFFLFGCLCLPVLLALWLACLFLKTCRIWLTAVLAASFASPFLFAHFSHASADIKAVGLRDRLEHDHLITNIREFARDFDQLQPQSAQNKLNSAGDLKAWAGKYPYLAWPKEGASAPYLYPVVTEDDGIVTLKWGGAFGHWGFSAGVNGKDAQLPDTPDSSSLRLAKDIYVISED